MLIFLESVGGLQSELNSLPNCAEPWGLKMKIKKTKQRLLYSERIKIV